MSERERQRRSASADDGATSPQVLEGLASLHPLEAAPARVASDARGAQEALQPIAAPEEGDPAGLALLAQARAGEGLERASTLATWAAGLRQIPASPGARASRAEALLGALASQDLGALDGFRGATARSLAVEGLLALGYPHALEVHPADLLHLREVQARGVRGAARKGLRLCLGLSAGGQLLLAAVWAMGAQGSPVETAAALAVAVVAPLAAGGWMAWVRASPWILHPHVRPVD